ncbi:MAG: hypothetical protein ACHBN1_28180 [Heteroscytonema crispum UTEX LB 1556]
MGRSQDRSGSPNKGAKLTGGNLPDCRRKRPFTNHQPLRGEARWDARLLEGRFAIATAKRSTSRLGRETLPLSAPSPPTTLRENQLPARVYPPAVRASPPTTAILSPFIVCRNGFTHSMQLLCFVWLTIEDIEKNNYNFFLKIYNK